MNKRQAKSYALRCLAAEARHHVGNASEWLDRPLRSDNISVEEDGAFSDGDRQRIIEAVEEVADELARRSERLST